MTDAEAKIMQDLDEGFKTMLQFIIADHERLLRLESMVVFMLEREKMTMTAKPSLDQAKRLEAMGQQPWESLVRATNAYEVWKEQFDRKMTAYKGEHNVTQA